MYRSVFESDACVALALSAAWEQTKLNSKVITSKIVEENGFTVVGIGARTSNAKEMTEQGVIPKQWERLMKEDLVNKIPDKADSSIIAVYTDYESDKDGEYTIPARSQSDLSRQGPSWDGCKESPTRPLCCLYLRERAGGEGGR